MNATVEIKLAKNGGKKEEKKRGGAILPWWARGSRGWLGGLAGKLAVTLAVAALGAGAHLAGVADRPSPAGVLAKPRAPKLFAARAADARTAYDVDPASLPGGRSASQDSLSLVVSGSDQRKDPAATGASPSSKASGSASRKSPDADAGKTAGATVDPAALAAQAAGPVGAAARGSSPDRKDGGKESPFKSRFGALSQGFGSSPSLAGGAGMAGGSNGAFQSLKAPEAGRLKAFGGSAQISRAGGLRSRSSARSAFGQLVNAANLSQGAAKAATGEAAAAGASAAFDGGGKGGATIAGNGAAVGGAGAAPAGEASSGSGEGGPVTSSPGNGGETAPQARSSDCGVMSRDVGRSLVANADGGCVPDVNHADKTPWSEDSQRAQYALLVAALALAAANLLNTWAKNNSTWGKFCKIAVRLLAVVALGAAAAAIVEGGIIWSKGGQIEGAMDILGGLISGVMAYKLLKDTAGSSEDVKQKLQENQQTAQDVADDKLENGPQHWSADGTAKGWTDVPELSDAPQAPEPPAPDAPEPQEKPFIVNDLPADAKPGPFDEHGNGTFVGADADGGGSYTFTGQNTDGKPVFTYDPPEGVSSGAKWVSGSNGEPGFWIDPHTGEEWTANGDGTWSRAQRG